MQLLLGEQASGYQPAKLLLRGVPVLSPPSQRPGLDHRDSVPSQLQRTADENAERAAANGDVDIHVARRRTRRRQRENELGWLCGGPLAAEERLQRLLLSDEALQQRRATRAASLSERGGGGQTRES